MQSEQRRMRPMSALVKAFTSLFKGRGPYIGPKGGKWSDPQHKHHWESGGGQQLDLLAHVPKAGHDAGMVRHEKIDAKEAPAKKPELLDPFALLLDPKQPEPAKPPAVEPVKAAAATKPEPRQAVPPKPVEIPEPAVEPERNDDVALAMKARGLVWHKAMNADGRMVGYWIRPETQKVVKQRGDRWEEALDDASSQDPFKRWVMKRFDGSPYPYKVPSAAITPGDAFEYTAKMIMFDGCSARIWEMSADGVWTLMDTQITTGQGDNRTWINTRASMSDLRKGERVTTGEVFDGRRRRHYGAPPMRWDDVYERGLIYVAEGIDPNTETRTHENIITGLLDAQKAKLEEAATKIKRERDEEEQKRRRHQEAAWDTYTWPSGAPQPDNAYHPRLIPDLDDRRFSAWSWDENRREYRKSVLRSPDRGSWLQRLHPDDGQYTWQKVQAEHPGCIFVPADEMPIYAKPEPASDVIQLGVSMERPPDFLALNMNHIETREIQDGRFTNHVPTGAEEWLHEHGFWQALDKKEGHRGFLAQILINQAHRGATYVDTRSEKVRSFIAQSARALAAWWSDINDEEREYFYKHFCDERRQPRVVRPNDPRQENANFVVPPGMEKLIAKGWSFHEYQKKAMNFAADHAKRALWALEMGCGKTLMAVGLYHHLKARRELSRLIVTAPTSAIGSWEDEWSGNSNAKVKIIAEATAKQRTAAYQALRKGEIDVLVMTPYCLGLPAIGDSMKLTAAAVKKAPDGTGVMTPLTDKKRSFWQKRGDEWVSSDWQEPGTPSRVVSNDAMAKLKPSITLESYDRQAWALEDLDAMQLRRIIDENPTDFLRVADEVHLFKNEDAARRRGFEHAFCAPEGRVVGMSGTPKPNGPEDFYTIVNDITRGALGKDVNEFAKRYCYESTGKWGGILGFRPDALTDLYRDNAGFLFARTTADPDTKVHLPPQHHLSPRLKPDQVQTDIQAGLVLAMGLQQQALADEAYARSQGKSGYSPAREQLNRMADGGEGPLLQLCARKVPWDERSLLIRLKQASIAPSILDSDGSVTGEGGPLAGYESPKMQAVCDAAVTHMSQNPDTGAVLFSTSVGGLYAMRNALVKRGVVPEEIGIIHGGIAQKVREQIRRDLNEGKLKFVLGQTKALNTGANMQARANFVAHIDTPWEPDVLVQSTARVHRQGQKRKVTVFRPMGSDVDALIERRVAGKLRANANALGVTMVSDKVALESMVGRGLNDDQFTESLAKTLGVTVDVLKPKGDRILTGMREIIAGDKDEE